MEFEIDLDPKSYHIRSKVITQNRTTIRDSEKEIWKTNP